MGTKFVSLCLTQCLFEDYVLVHGIPEAVHRDQYTMADSHCSVSQTSVYLYCI